MKTAIMQPYFFPYIGYWQMISAADIFVIYDDVNYIKNGWINRNNILLNGQPHLITLSLDKASPFNKINETYILNSKKNKENIIKTLEQNYRKAPYYTEIINILKSIINNNESNIALYLRNQFDVIFNYLSISTKIIMSSEVEKDFNNSAEDRVIQICKKLNTDIYINAIGGQKLYDKQRFKDKQITLNFIKTKPFEYKQFKNDFVRNLSIIDILMFNSKDAVRNILNEYELI